MCSHLRCIHLKFDREIPQFLLVAPFLWQTLTRKLHLVKHYRSLGGNVSPWSSKQAQNCSNLWMKDISFSSSWKYLKTLWSGVSTPTEIFSWRSQVLTQEFSQPWPWEQVGLFESGRGKTLWTWHKTFSFLKHMTCRETTRTSAGFSAWPLVDREDPADRFVPLTSSFISTCGSNSHLRCPNCERYHKVFVSETCCRWVNVAAIHSSV